jgi:hypothetical protein
VILFILDNDTFEVCANAFDQMSSRNALVILVTDCKKKIIEHYQVKKKEEKKIKIEKKKTLKLKKVDSLLEQQKLAETEEEKNKLKVEADLEMSK